MIRDLSVKSQGVGWLVLNWKPPAGAGTYHIERGRRDNGDWEQIAHAIAAPRHDGIDRVERLGFRVDRDLTEESRVVAESGHYRDKDLLFCRDRGSH